MAIDHSHPSSLALFDFLSAFDIVDREILLQPLMLLPDLWHALLRQLIIVSTFMTEVLHWLLTPLDFNTRPSFLSPTLNLALPSNISLTLCVNQSFQHLPAP